MNALLRLLASACIVAALGAATADAQTSVPRSRTLVIAQNFDPQTLWPNGTTASDNLNAGSPIVEALFWQNPRNSQVEGLLAESFSTETPTSHLIRLRRGISFTNGEPMNADAVVHSINLFVDPRTTPAYAIYAAALDRAEKVDEHTVRLHTKYPTPNIALVLTQIYVVPPVYWSEVAAAGFGTRPIGTGPFRLTEWVRDNRVVMDRNPGYRGPAPAGIDRVIWRPVPDEAARAAGLETGEYDVAATLPVAAAMRLENQPNLRIVSIPSYRIYHVTLSSLSMHPSPLQDRRVRQALNYAIDKRAIVDRLFFGRAQMLNGQLLRREQPGFNPAVQDYPYDPARARQLLAEAGYPNGFEVLFKVPSGRYPQDREVSEAVAGMLARVGVRTRIQALEAGEFLRQLRVRELGPMTFLGLAPPDDPDFQVGQYRSDWRYAYVQNPEFDRLIDAGRQEMDPQARVRIYQELMRLMHEEAPVVFLYQGVDLYGVSSRVRDFAARGDQRIFLYGVSLAER